MSAPAVKTAGVFARKVIAMDRKTWVSPDKENKDWTVRDEGGSRNLRRFDTKQEAVDWATNRGRNANLDNQVLIQKRNGEIQEERTYPRSADPRKSRG